MSFRCQMPTPIRAKLWSVVGPLTIIHRHFIVGTMYVKLTDQFLGFSHKNVNKTSPFLGSYCTDFLMKLLVYTSILDTKQVNKPINMCQNR